MIPKAARALYHACVIENDARKGLRIFERILSIVHLVTHQLIGPVSDLAIYRSILNCWGLEGGYSRHPFYPLTEEQEAKVRHILKDTGWLDPDHALDSVVQVHFFGTKDPRNQ